MSNQMTDYERKALAEIHAWKTPNVKPPNKTLAAIRRPFAKAANNFMDRPAVQKVMEKTIGGLVSLLTDAAGWTVRDKAIIREFQKMGHTDVHAVEDLKTLRLEDVDKAIGYLGAKYKALAALEGAATGILGWPGIPIDIVAIIGLNLRAVCEYATYCGFNVSLQQERLFCMNVLGLASSSTDPAKYAALAQLIKISKAVAMKQPWAKLEQHAFVTLVQRVAKALGVRLTKQKLGQVIPAVGLVVGAGFNTHYTWKVCEASYFLYRERFLAEKYGPDVIEATVEAAESFAVGEPEE